MGWPQSGKRGVIVFAITKTTLQKQEISDINQTTMFTYYCTTARMLLPFDNIPDLVAVVGIVHLLCVAKMRYIGVLPRVCRLFAKWIQIYRDSWIIRTAPFFREVSNAYSLEDAMSGEKDVFVFVKPGFFGIPHNNINGNQLIVMEVNATVVLYGTKGSHIDICVSVQHVFPKAKLGLINLSFDEFFVEGLGELHAIRCSIFGLCCSGSMQLTCYQCKFKSQSKSQSMRGWISVFTSSVLPYACKTGPTTALFDTCEFEKKLHVRDSHVILLHCSLISPPRQHSNGGMVEFVNCDSALVYECDFCVTELPKGDGPPSAIYSMDQPIHLMADEEEVEGSTTFSGECIKVNGISAVYGPKLRDYFKRLLEEFMTGHFKRSSK